MTAVPDLAAVNDEAAREPAAVRRAVEAVHRASGQQLFGFARRLGLRDDEAEDVVQEALLRLWRTVGRGVSIESPVAWTFRTTYRLAMDRHRFGRRWRSFVDRYDGRRPTPGHDVDERLAVWSEVDRLPPGQRAAIYLHYQADLTFAVVGQVLGIEAATARSNASRGIATLRERLGRED